MRPARLDVIAIAAVLVCYAAVVGPTVPAARFSYDEADYMYAASRGFAANYLDRPTLPFATFIRKGLGDGMNQGERVSLSEFIRANDDIAFYRHFHPPLYYYGLIPLSQTAGGAEQTTRWLSFAGLLMAFIAVALGCLALAKTSPRTTAVIASTLLLTSSANVATARLITPHALYVATVLVALFVMAKLVDTGQLRYWYAALAALTLAVLTIEYAVLLVVTLAVCAFVRRADLFAGRDRRQLMLLAGRSVLLILSMIVLIWPAGLLKLTLVKNYIFFAYFAVVRSKSYGTDSAATVWMDQIAESPLQFGVIIAGLSFAVYLLIRRRLDAWLLPFAVYAFLMLLTTALNRSREPTYISSLVPVVAVIAAAAWAIVLTGARPAVRIPITGAIVGALAVGSFSMLSRPPVLIDTPGDVVVDLLLPQGRTTRARVLMPNFVRPTVHYYFPNLSTSVYPDSLPCTGLQVLADSGGWNGIICRGLGQPVLEQQLKRQHDVTIRRGGSAEKGRELVYYALESQIPRE